MNNCAFIGNLTSDPQGGSDRNGKSWCRFSIAVNRRYAGPDGTREADFIPVVVFGVNADNCLQYLAKGRKVGVTGALEIGKYTDENGQERGSICIRAEAVDFLPSGQKDQAHH